jgi:hypothetical protein
MPARCSVAAIACLCLAAEIQAAELPVAEPADYQQACPDQEQGFVRIAGTDICLRIGGEVEVEASKGVGKELDISTSYDNQGRPIADRGLVEIADEFTGLSSEGEISVVTQANTDFGELITSLELRGTADELNLIESAVSFGGLTAGYQSSFFDIGSGYNESAGLSSDRSTTVFAYTASLSDDLTITASLEDGALRRFQEGSWAQYGGQRTPELVAVVDWEPEDKPSWIHAAAAAHGIRDLRPGSDEEIGWAGMVAAGRRFSYGGDARGRVLVTGAVARGAIDYLGIPVNTPDYIREKSGKLALAKGVSGLISYQHVWGPTLRSAATVSYYRTKADAQTIDWNTEGFWLTVGSEYLPAPRLAFGVDVTYYLDRTWSGDDRDASTDAESVVAIGYVRRNF